MLASLDQLLFTDALFCLIDNHSHLYLDCTQFIAMVCRYVRVSLQRDQ